MKESVLVSQIASIRPRRDRGQALGIHSQSRWQGGAQVKSGLDEWRVVQCDSVLEIRQRLCELNTEPLVLITPLPGSAMEDDIKARLYKQMLFTVDPWNALAERFKARQVDPSLRQSTALADLALDALGLNETPVAPSGILTAESVWQLVLRHRMGLTPARPDLLDFLPWMTSDGAGSRWESLGAAVQKQLEAWLVLSLGELGSVLLGCLSDGHGPDAIAVGFVLGALMAEGSNQRAMGRLEGFLGIKPLDSKLAHRWNDAAERWASRAEVERVRRELERADQILESLGAAECAMESRWSLLGFQQRLISFSEQLASDDRKKSQAAFALIDQHEGSRRLEELAGRRERASMAMRLMRWLERSSAPAPTLLDAVSLYELGGSWVDWARHKLLTGDESEGIGRVYRKLFDKVTARREEENRRFGELLASSVASKSFASGVLAIEDAISTVVAPLAKNAPSGVLLIVMDGMSIPVWRELSVDLSRHGWEERAPEDGPSYRCAVTVIPSVTNYSRTSLLCGALMSGGQNVERRGFQEHLELRSMKPELFHQNEVGSSGADLSESLRLAVGRSETKLVGVVLNVIDDSLGGPEQLSIQWTLRSIPVLQALLSEARNAGRVVVFASDHGHVIDHGSELRRKVESPDRWRAVSTGVDLSRDELLVKGTRVLAEGGQVIAPTSEAVRYTATPRLGYHGGLTAQECVAPLAVMAPALVNIPGWDLQLATAPEWWFENASEAVAERPKAKKPSKRKEPARQALSLFDAGVPECDWVDALLASAVFAEQMETFAGRLKRDQVEQSLRALSERNNVLMKSAFAQKLGLSALRVDGLIASLQRILNVESYAVLSVDSSQTIRLNLALLREQFELGDDNGR